MLQMSVIGGREGGTFMCMGLAVRRKGEGGTSDIEGYAFPLDVFDIALLYLRP